MTRRPAGLVKGAFEQIRQAARGNLAVSIRLLQTFRRLAEQIELLGVRVYFPEGRTHGSI